MSVMSDTTPAIAVLPLPEGETEAPEVDLPERMEGEPEKDYCHFLTWLALGPGRSLAGLQAVLNRNRTPTGAKTASNRPRAGRTEAGGKLRLLSSRWQWRTRVQAYDAKVIMTTGRRAATHFMRTIGEMARLAYESFAARKHRPGSLRESLELVQALSALIPREVLSALVSNAHAEEEASQPPPDQLLPPYVPPLELSGHCPTPAAGWGGPALPADERRAS